MSGAQRGPMRRVVDQEAAHAVIPRRFVELSADPLHQGLASSRVRAVGGLQHVEQVQGVRGFVVTHG